jgi:signal transduction histidine kinase/ligand-binding sensor domain-containing protein
MLDGLVVSRISPVRGWQILVFLLLPRVAQAVDLRLQPLPVRMWSRPGGMFGLAQAPDGMLWLASSTGLSRFDGERFTDVDLGLASPWVRRVLVTRDGTVWAATGNGTLEFAERTGSEIVPQHAGGGAELVRLSPSRATNEPDRVLRFRPGELPSPWVWALAEDAAGTVWIATEAGLARWAGGRLERFGTADGLPAALVTALAIGPDGTLYVGTTAGVAIHRGGRFVPTQIHTPVLALAPDRAGRLWATGSYQVLRADPDGSVHAFDTAQHEWIGVDRDDNVWTGRRVFAGGVPVPVAGPDKGGYWATGILVDREGSVWFTVREGFVVQIRSPPVRNFGREEGAPGRVAYAVLPARDGSIYVSGEGGVGRYAGGSWRIWRNGPDVGWGPIDLAEDPGGIWLTSSRLARGGPAGFHAARIPPDGIEYRSLVSRRQGDLWVSLERGGLHRFAGGDTSRAPEEWTAARGLCGGRLIHGLEASDGSLWFASSYDVPSTQVARIENGQARCYGTADGLPPARIGAVAEDQRGTIWLGTGWGAGLVRFRGGRFATVPASRGLPQTSITGIADDLRGNLWLCTVAGVWRVPRAEIDRCADAPCPELHATVFGKDEGMRNAECIGDFGPNIAVDQAGTVWAATLGGFAAFAAPERARVRLPRPIIEEIALDGVPITASDQVRLGPGQSDLVVRYTAATFVGESRPRLRHRLRGFDAEWLLASSPAIAHYHGLRPGRYVLEIQTGSAAEAITALAVIVAPPFWRTPSFLLLVLATAGTGGLTIHRSRVARLRLHQRAVTAERARIARDLHDGLAQKLTTIGLLTETPVHTSPELARVREIVDEAHAELRRAIWDMREPSGGQERLEHLVERALSDLVIPPSIAVKLDTAASLLPVGGLALREVPLIVREAVINALRHARPRRIEVGVLSDEDGLQVWVTDDGSGLPPGATGGTGFIGMHERARRLGGVLTISSNPAQGTNLTLFVTRDRVAGARP